MSWGLSQNGIDAKGKAGMLETLRMDGEWGGVAE
jgi:hypothetical protein